MLIKLKKHKQFMYVNKNNKVRLGVKCSTCSMAEYNEQVLREESFNVLCCRQIFYKTSSCKNNNN